MRKRSWEATSTVCYRAAEQRSELSLRTIGPESNSYSWFAGFELQDFPSVGETLFRKMFVWRASGECCWPRSELAAISRLSSARA